MIKTLRFALACVAVATISSASVVQAGIVTLSGAAAGTGHDELVGADWLSVSANDIDGSGGLGTDGFIFAGLYDGTASNNDGMFTTTQTLPSYVSNVVGNTTNVIGTTFGNTAYGQIDNPTTLDGANISGGFWINSAGGVGSFNETLSFDISGLVAGETVRVGVLTGLHEATNGRWDAAGIRITDGTNTAEYTSLLQNPGGSHTGTGIVYFDIDMDGTYSLLGQKRLTSQGAGINGLTFDSVVTIPEPSSLALIGLAGMGMFIRRRK